VKQRTLVSRLGETGRSCRRSEEHRLVYVDGSFLAAQQNTTPPARRTADRPVRQARSIAIASRELLPRVARGEAQRRLGHLRHSSAPPVAFTSARLVPRRRGAPSREPPGWKFPVEHSYTRERDSTCPERIDRRKPLPVPASRLLPSSGAAAYRSRFPD